MSDVSVRPETSVHATCVVLRETGILIRGPSNAGKSTLARELILAGEAMGWFACLVGDDRVRLAHRHGRLLAEPHPALAGWIEMRGFGPMAETHQPACVVRLVVDLDDAPPSRLPAPDEMTVELLGVRLPRLPAALPGACSTVLWRLRGQDDTQVTGP